MEGLLLRVKSKINIYKMGNWNSAKYLLSFFFFQPHLSKNCHIRKVIKVESDAKKRMSECLFDWHRKVITFFSTSHGTCTASSYKLSRHLKSVWRFNHLEKNYIVNEVSERLYFQSLLIKDILISKVWSWKRENKFMQWNTWPAFFYLHSVYTHTKN